MKKTTSRIVLILGLMISLYTVNGQQNYSIYDLQISLDSLEGGKIDFSNFKGKKVLFVNVASKCGYTSQYAQLQELHEKYKDQLTIIGLPCNQFANQEPGTASEIATFCKRNFGVSFLMTEKIDVMGDNQNIIYSFLTQKSMNNVLDSKVNWNFQKYLVDEEGRLLQVFGSSTNPLDSDITNLL